MNKRQKRKHPVDLGVPHTGDVVVLVRELRELAQKTLPNISIGDVAICLGSFYCAQANWATFVFGEKRNMWINLSFEFVEKLEEIVLDSDTMEHLIFELRGYHE